MKLTAVFLKQAFSFGLIFGLIVSSVLAGPWGVCFGQTTSSPSSTSSSPSLKPPLSIQMAHAALNGQFDERNNPLNPKWNYETATLMAGLQSVWMNSADPVYYQFIKSKVDAWVEADGSIKTYKAEENQLDHILLGRQLLMLYRVTLDKKYALAAQKLHDQLKQQPRNPSGGFWHKQRYPNQMWLDGLYMAEPFYAEYAQTFHQPDAFKDIALQFKLIDAHLRDSKTGLLYHAWDESKQQRWADATTGRSSYVWARAMGWYLMALVDTLDDLPADDPAHAQLVKQLVDTSTALLKVQDAQTGLWFQILDKPDAKGNYLESSAASMFVYALAKGVRQAYLPPAMMQAALRGYQGIVERFVKVNEQGVLSLTTTVKGVGLGGEPYRDGSYEYYVGEKVVTNDPKGIGAFLLASVEVENAEKSKLGRGKKVVVDAWFNSQQRANFLGQKDLYHYKWQDRSNSGFSLLGHVFNAFGAQTAQLAQAPTPESLKGVDVYLLVSPDNSLTNPAPHFMTPESAKVIADWVEQGGVLLVFENDPLRADIEHMNLLTDPLGIHFNSVMRNEVAPGQYEQGAVEIPAGGNIFKQAHHAFMKEICTLTTSAPAQPELVAHGEVLMASARHGQGTVFATVDPWLYNEYLDGRRLPASFDNWGAAQEWVAWVLSLTKPLVVRP